MSDVFNMGISHFMNCLEHGFYCDIEYLINVVRLCRNKKFEWIKCFGRIELLVCVIIPPNWEVVTGHIWVWEIWNNHESIFLNKFFQLTQKWCKHFKAVDKCANWVTDHHTVNFLLYFKLIIENILAQKLKFVGHSNLSQLNFGFINHFLRYIKTNYFFGSSLN